MLSHQNVNKTPILPLSYPGAKMWRFGLIVTLSMCLCVPGEAFRPGNETGLIRKDHLLKIAPGDNFLRFRGSLKGSLFFDLNFFENDKIVYNIRAFPWGDVDYEGKEIIDMWSR